MKELLIGVTSGDFKSIAFVIAVISVSFEFAPIKINPIGSLLKWTGKKMFEPFDSKLEALEKSIDENEIDRIRWEVLDFANTCRNGRRHTKEEFDHIISQNDKYHNLLEKYKAENGVFDAEYAYVMRLYKKCQDENDFL
jgi:hypothetical protein